MLAWNSIKEATKNVVSFSGKKRPLPSSSSSSGTSSGPSPGSPLPDKNLGTVIKAPLDKKHYKVIKLQNGLRICLVSTCELEISKDSASKSSYTSFLSSSQTKIPKLENSPKGPSSVCVCVGAGSLQDPWQTNGLAQLVEHLIFLGSKQYPKPSTISTKVYQNGGIVNASTHFESTNFYFQCNSQAFEECVSILVDGLINPLFKSSAIKAAIEIIDSDFTINQAQDINLMGDFLRSLFTSGHPLSKSCRGNKETLQKPTIKEEVINWKQRYYRANYMTVCIQSPMSIQELEKFAVNHFSDIPGVSPSWNWKSPSVELLGCGEPYKKESFQAAYFLAPLTQINYLMITWALPAKFWKSYESKPLEYTRLILESTSKGGLKHYLRKMHWISEWSNLSVNRCWRDDYYRNVYCSMFELTIILTDQGYQNKKDVVQAVFSYLKKLRRESVGLHLNEDFQLNKVNKFHYQNWEEMLQSGAEIAVNMQRVNKPSHLLTSMDLVTRFNPALIDEVLAGMLPCKANYIFASHKNLAHCKEVVPQGRMRYSKEEFSPVWYKLLEDTEIFQDFAWPEFKHFAPREISQRTGGTALTRVGTVYKDKKLTVEYLSAKKASWVTPRVPSASIFVHFSSPTVGNCPVKLAVLEYWTRLLNDRMVAQAGHQFDHHFTFGVEVVGDGITVNVAGPRCHLVELLVLVVQEIFGRFGFVDGIAGDREAAENLKLDLLQESTNKMFDVETLSKDIMSYIQYEGYTMQAQVKNLLLGNGYCKVFLDFRREMLVNVKLHGCITIVDLNGIVKLLNGTSHKIVNYSPPAPRVSPPSSSQNADKAMLLPVGTRRLPIISMQPAYTSTVTTNFYQMDGCGWSGQHIRNYVSILHVLLRRHIVNQLITREQLGYKILFVPWTNGPLGLSVTILTLPDKYAPYFVDLRIDLFFREFYEQTLKNERTRMFLKKYCFKGKEPDKLVVGLECFYKENLLKEGSNFRKLSIQLQGYAPNTDPTKGDSDCLETLQYLTVDDEEKQKLKSEGVELITDIAEFKNSLSKLETVPN